MLEERFARSGQETLIAAAVKHMAQYKQYTAGGDFTKAAEELKALDSTLTSLAALQKNP